MFWRCPFLVSEARLAYLEVTCRTAHRPHSCLPPWYPGFLLHAIRLFPRGYLGGCNYQFERDGQMVLVAEEVSALLGLCSLQALVPAPDIVK